MVKNWHVFLLFSMLCEKYPALFVWGIFNNGDKIILFTGEKGTLQNFNNKTKRWRIIMEDGSVQTHTEREMESFKELEGKKLNFFDFAICFTLYWKGYF